MQAEALPFLCEGKSPSVASKADQAEETYQRLELAGGCTITQLHISDLCFSLKPLQHVNWISFCKLTTPNVREWQRILESQKKEMGAFGVIVGTLHYMGLYIQLTASTRQGGHAELVNHISGNAVFTEVPHDITAQSGQDVEMACSFRGAGPSYSLEIQWWYIRNHRDWTEKQPWTTNQVVPQDEMSKDATKISVVKVAGSNISHKLRLSSVKPSDEGTYECRVIDFSDTDSNARHHKVRAYLQVESERNQNPKLRHHGENFQPQDTKGLASSRHQPEHGKHSPAAHHKPTGTGRELRKRSAETGSATDCTDSCPLHLTAHP